MEQNINEVIANPGSERIILANCLNNPDTIIDCESEGLSPKHFAVDAHRIIYSAIMYLFTKNASIDAISIQNIIKDDKAKKTVDDMGGLEYILLLQQSPITPNVSIFVQQVVQCYTRRQIYTMCDDVQNKVIKAETDDIELILGGIQNDITNIVLETSKVEDAYHFGDKLGERLQLRAEQPNEVPGLPSGFKQFDKITKGGQAGDLIITCAESKTGKSVWLLNVAKHQAIDLLQPVLYIDSEQSNEEEEFRLLSIVSQIPEDELTTGMFMQDTGYGKAKDKIERIQDAKARIKKAQLFHISMPDFTLEKVQAVTRKFHLKYGIQSLFMDYIDFNPALLAQNKHMRDDMILTNFTVGLKNIGGELKIPVYTAAQENRTGYGSATKDAKKNIGGSLGILQKATKLCFLRNKTEEELATEGAHRGNQKMLIAYQRHGAREIEIDMMFDKPKITMHEAG